MRARLPCAKDSGVQRNLLSPEELRLTLRRLDILGKSSAILTREIHLWLPVCVTYQVSSEKWSLLKGINLLLTGVNSFLLA